MWRKVFGIGAVVLLVGALIGGAAYILLRGNTGQGGLHAGRGSASGGYARGSQSNPGSSWQGGGGGSSRGGPAASGSTGSAQGRGAGEGAGLAASADLVVWQTISGTVIEAGTDLVVQTEDGQAVTVNTGPAQYRDAQGVVLLPGDAVRLTGFYDGDTFVVSRVENQATGQALALRDESGRPLWSGPGRRGP